MGINILPVARAMVGHYENKLTAERVVYDLVKGGTGRHSITIYPADENGVNTDRYNFDEPEKVAEQFYKDDKSEHGYLVVAWVWKSRRAQAEEIMQSYNHLGLKNRASKWFAGGTPFQLINKNKPKF